MAGRFEFAVEALELFEGDLGQGGDEVVSSDVNGSIEPLAHDAKDGGLDVFFRVLEFRGFHGYG